MERENGFADDTSFISLSVAASFSFLALEVKHLLSHPAMLTERDIKVGKQLLGLSGIDDWKSFCKNYLFFSHA